MHFKNKKSMSVIFFFKYSKFNLDFENAAKNGKTFFDSYIIASDLVSLNYLY